MKVTVLGYSDGIQTKDSGNTSLLFQSKGTSILVDVSGSPSSSLLCAGINPVNLDAIVLTHAHIDHIYAYPSLIHNMWLLKRKKRLYVFGNSHVIDKAKSLLSLFNLDEKKDMMEIVYSEENGNVGNVSIIGFSLFHRPLVPTCGFSFKDEKNLISYFPDSVASSIIPSCAINSDLLIHEAHGLKYQEEELAKAGHSSGRMAANIALQLDVKKLMLIHLPTDINLREEICLEAKETYLNTILAEKMKEYIVE